MNWTPLVILPNINLNYSIDSGCIALTDVQDIRLQDYAERTPNFVAFLGKFKDAFGKKLAPAIIMIRDDKLPKATDTMITSFRDILAISTIPYARALGIVYRNGGRINYSSSFWFYPWTLDKNGENLLAFTPGFTGLHVVEKFHGQSHPELPEIGLDSTFFDLPLFAVLMAKWQDYYFKNKKTWQNRTLFRSLNMAFNASLLPAGTGVTIYDLGRTLALWVSAFEILVHPKTGKSGVASVQAVLQAVGYREKKVRARRRKVAGGIGGKRYPLPCWLYGLTNKVRNDFLHGNKLGRKPLMPSGVKQSLAWIAPVIFRFALTQNLALNIEQDNRVFPILERAMMKSLK